MLSNSGTLRERLVRICDDCIYLTKVFVAVGDEADTIGKQVVDDMMAEELRKSHTINLEPL